MLELTLVDAENPFFSKVEQKYEGNYRDSLRAQKALASLSAALHEEGFVAASFDTIRRDSLKWEVDLFIGTKYNWFDIRDANLAPGLSKAFHQTMGKGKPVNLNAYRVFISDILEWYGNQGYPFAQIQWDSLRIHEKSISGILKVEKGLQVRNGSLEMPGDDVIHPFFLRRFLAFQQGKPFHYSSVEDISFRLQQLEYLRQTRPLQLELREQEAALFLYLDDRPANQFDAIVGLSSGSENSNQLQFTGEARLVLQNQLKRGEALNFFWKGMPGSSQRMNVGISYPYLGRTPLSLKGQFQLYKQDTSFLNLKARLGGIFDVSLFATAEIFYTYKDSRPIGTNNANLSEASYHLWGMAYHYQKMEQPLNPVSGFQLEVENQIGQRKFASVTAQDSLNIENSDIHLEVATSLSWYFPVYRSFVFAFHHHGSWMHAFGENEQMYAENELSRFGGSSLLRGFEEDAFYANSYTVNTAELRWVLNELSAIFLFYDQAWYSTQLQGAKKEDTPYGFGLGGQIGMRNGLFTISYALGSQQENPVDLQSGIIHIAYTARF